MPLTSGADPIYVFKPERHRVQTFRPDEAMGAALDGMTGGEVARVITPFNIKAMQQAGLRPLSYRLRTELGIEAWHWNPKGHWSNEAQHQGYWISDDTPEPKAPITLSFGYNLPRRGNSADNANNKSYSRLDDGDEKSFWKSNPYLDKLYTGLSANRPQWVNIDLGQAQAVNWATISFAEPYATDYEVQYWVGVDEYDPAGYWQAYPKGVMTGAKGGLQQIDLSGGPLNAQYIRLYLKTGSNTAPNGALDVRDRLGFAISEIYIGHRDEAGHFEDYIKHGITQHSQTLIRVSSTDPWHREMDRDKDLEQPGLDLIYRSGLGNNLPIMIPVGVLFDTPENGTALISYLKKQHYPLDMVELGEEPDGQLISGRDYADLYLEAVDKIKVLDPHIRFGGPSLQSGDTHAYMDNDPIKNFTGLFIDQLKLRHRLADLKFFSFERYAFDNMCGDMSELMRQEKSDMQDILAQLRSDGVPKQRDWIISEYGFSAYSGRPMVELPSALLNADMVAQFLSKGGKRTYLFGYNPDTPINQHLECAGYGNMMLHLADSDGQAKAPMPAFYGAVMMSQYWVKPGHGRHDLYRVNSPIKDDKGRDLVSAYVVKRPDGRLSVMMINESDKTDYHIRFDLSKLGIRTKAYHLWQYSPKNYVWHPDKENGHPDRDEAPDESQITTLNNIDLPAYSITVITQSGRIFKKQH